VKGGGHGDYRIKVSKKLLVAKIITFHFVE